VISGLDSTANLARKLGRRMSTVHTMVLRLFDLVGLATLRELSVFGGLLTKPGPQLRLGDGDTLSEIGLDVV